MQLLMYLCPRPSRASFEDRRVYLHDVIVTRASKCTEGRNGTDKAACKRAYWSNHCSVRRAANSFVLGRYFWAGKGDTRLDIRHVIMGSTRLSDSGNIDTDICCQCHYQHRQRKETKEIVAQC